jgi:hypothetical protein
MTTSTLLSDRGRTRQRAGDGSPCEGQLSRQALQGDNLDSVAWHRLGRGQESRGQFDEALASYEQCPTSDYVGRIKG